MNADIEIGTYDDVCRFLKLSRATIYKYTCHKKFPDGVYLDSGRFNMSKLKKHINEKGTFLRTCAK